MKYLSHFIFLALAIAASGAVIPKNPSSNDIAEREAEALPVVAADIYQVRDTDEEEHKKKKHHHKKPTEARDIDEVGVHSSLFVLARNTYLQNMNRTRRRNITTIRNPAKLAT
jgi:hypothetical protein